MPFEQMMKPAIRILVLILLLASVNPGETVPATALTENRSSFIRLHADRLDVRLLTSEIVRYTNRIRRERQLPTCETHSTLMRAAQSHSEEMARLEYISHESPIRKNAHLIDRLTNTGMTLSNVVVGENLGVDYLLKIANIPFYKHHIDGEIQFVNSLTKQAIKNQTYAGFARQMVNNWLNSPGHCENLLDDRFEYIGIGAALGRYNGLTAIYVTQNFMGPSSSANRGLNTGSTSPR